MTENILPFNEVSVKSALNLEDKNYTDWHSKNTIIFGSLIEDGFDWGKNDWNSYSISSKNLTSIRERINEKIEDRFYFRELGVLPPAKFRRFLIRNISEIMAQEGPIYEKLIDGFDIFSSSEKTKNRIINSEYPQAQLQTEQKDYASSAIEQANEKTTTNNQLETFILYSENFSEPDKKVLDYVDKCFSHFTDFTL